jgi:Uroporphyrinogen-III decarboxylase
MTTRERIMAVLNYEKYDRLPLIHFGYWNETLEKWKNEGHISEELFQQYGGDGSYGDREVSRMLGFDFGWNPVVGLNQSLLPAFQSHIIEEKDDGSYLEFDHMGVTVLKKHGINSIPVEIAHTLTDRESWEKEYKHRLQFSPERVPDFSHLKDAFPTEPLGLHCGSLYGMLRDIAGIIGISYIYADDEDLYAEMIDTVADLSYNCVKSALEQCEKLSVKFDFAHFWEDICFKNGPLVSPSVFEEHVGKHYQKITDLLKEHGVNIVSLDCDGLIDALIPTWINHGVNTMFPIEVGTWNANIAPWREKYGKELRGVGGMDKRVFAYDYAAVDAEIKRLRPLIEAGGYIPCPDHRIAPDAKWENVQYYCEQMKKQF